MRIVFMGTPDFAVPSLEALVRAGYTPVGVATSEDARGRAPAVKKAAQRLGIETILQPKSVKSERFAEEVAALRPDLIVVVAFKILPPAVYQAARLGAFNLHGSLLPRYRGAAPIHRAVMAGETQTGVTTFFLKPQVDTGDLLIQRAMPIGPDETTGDVHDRMAALGAEVVVETIRGIEDGTLRPQPQDDALASPAPKIFRDEAQVDWSRPAEEVHDFIRGLSPYPAAWTEHEGTSLKLYRSRLAEGSGAPGEVLEASDRLVVACGEGAVVLTELQAEGRKRLGAADFLNGYPLEEGDRLG